MSKARIPAVLGRDIVTGRTIETDLESLRQHLYIVGKTGCGKSTLLFNLIQQILRAGAGVCLLDPHGDLVEDVLASVPADRTSDVLLIEPSSPIRSVAWNPLFKVPVENRSRVAQGVLSAMRGVWGDSWGPRMEYILHNGLRLLLDSEHETLLGLQRLLVDGNYRSWLVRQSKDPVVSRFWTKEFASWDARFQREAVAPVQNKVGQILADPALRRILGQTNSKVDLRIQMDRGRIVLVNLSKGQMGEDSARLLGCLLVAAFQEAALSRAELAANERTPYFLVIDEVQNFSTTSFAGMLSEVRKYGLGLILSNQYLAQLQAEIRDAILGNVGSHLTFRLSGEDAKAFRTEFGEQWTEERYTDLPPFQAIVRLLDKRRLLQPRPIRTEPPLEAEPNDCRKIRAMSGERYGTRRDVIDNRIARWLARDYPHQGGKSVGK